MSLFLFSVVRALTMKHTLFLACHLTLLVTSDLDVKLKEYLRGRKSTSIVTDSPHSRKSCCCMAYDICAVH
jgi:hypothetical protein